MRSLARLGAHRGLAFDDALDGGLGFPAFGFFLFRHSALVGWSSDFCGDDVHRHGEANQQHRQHRQQVGHDFIVVALVLVSIETFSRHCIASVC